MTENHHPDLAERGQVERFEHVVLGGVHLTVTSFVVDEAHEVTEVAVREMEADGILATCVQHEIDHLEGRLFIDHISRLKRERVVKKFAKQAKREQVG